MVQTSITDNPERAYAGMPADASLDDVVTAVIQTAAGTTAGRFVSRDSTDEGECKAPAAAGDITSQTILGVVLRDVAREPAAFAQYATLSILRKGRVWVTIEDAFDVGDPIYIRKTSGGAAEVLGAVRTDSDSGDAVLVPGVILSSGDAGDLGLIEINFPFAPLVDEVASATLTGATYTPTITTGTNTTAGTAVGWYIRVGNVVHFTVRGSITHTAGAPTASTFEFSLPVASNLAAAGDLAAVVTGEGVSLGEGIAETTNNTGVASYSITGTGAKRVSISGSYTVL